MHKWQTREHSKKKPTRPEERWIKPIDLLTLYKIIRSDGRQVPKNSNHLSKDLLVMWPKLALSYLIAAHSTQSSEPNS